MVNSGLSDSFQPLGLWDSMLAAYLYGPEGMKLTRVHLNCVEETLAPHSPQSPSHAHTPLEQAEHS